MITPWRVVTAAWLAGFVLGAADPGLPVWADVAWALALALAAAASKWSTWASAPARMVVGMAAFGAWLFAAFFVGYRQPWTGLAYGGGVAGLLWAFATSPPARVDAGTAAIVARR